MRLWFHNKLAVTLIEVSATTRYGRIYRLVFEVGPVDHTTLTGSLIGSLMGGCLTGIRTGTGILAGTAVPIFTGFPICVILAPLWNVANNTTGPFVPNVYNNEVSAQVGKV